MNLDIKDYKKITRPVSHLNVGSGTDFSIKELAYKISKIVSYDGQISFDLDKPDGAPRKLMDSSKLVALGWNPKLTLIKLSLSVSRFY